jgi:hypothetical protein
MLMGKGSGCTGLLHTRCPTGPGNFQGMNLVTLSEPMTAGY